MQKVKWIWKAIASLWKASDQGSIIILYMLFKPELKDKPPSKADILRTLTRHSVGILLWKNHCQASVTCVGENVVLTAAHLFTPGRKDFKVLICEYHLNCLNFNSSILNLTAKQPLGRKKDCQSKEPYNSTMCYIFM